MSVRYAIVERLLYATYPSEMGRKRPLGTDRFWTSQHLVDTR